MNSQPATGGEDSRTAAANALDFALATICSTIQAMVICMDDDVENGPTASHIQATLSGAASRLDELRAQM